MNFIRFLLITTSALLNFIASPKAAAQDDPALHEILVCGWDEVFILDMSGAGEPRKIWSWRAAEREELPGDVRDLFKTTDECKSADGGKSVLITSSGGGVALVDRELGRVLFYGRAANAHSADLLPGGWVAVAASHDRQGRGDRLILFDRARSDEPLWSDTLPWGHGVVWDEERSLLWALADEDLRTYRLRDGDRLDPKLDRVATIPLPEGGGHDLAAVHGTSLMTVTTKGHCWIFDREDHTFVLHPVLGEHGRVKSISTHPQTRQVVFVQAEGTNWWAERLHFLNPEKTLHVPGEHFYKARWTDEGR